MGSNWYAPSLTSLQEASTADWPLHDITQLLKTGLHLAQLRLGRWRTSSARASSIWMSRDAHAMATYLKSLPQSDPRSRGERPPSRRRSINFLREAATSIKRFARIVMATSDKAGLTLTRRWRTTAVSPWHRRLTPFAAFFMVAMHR